MLKLLVVFHALVAIALSAEIKSSYANINKNEPLQADIKTQSVGSQSVKLIPEEHPIYRGSEGRARIKPVKVEDIAHSEMLSDQPAAPGTVEVNRVDNVQVPNYGFVPAQVHSDVAYPDIAYAPGYGYDNVYAPSNSYDAYGTGLTNYYADSEPTAWSLLWSQVPDSRAIVSFVGRTITWFINSTLVLALGSFLTVAVCSYTDLCSITFHGVGPIHEEMRALMSPERLDKISHAADFVKSAIDKYQKIQKVTDAARKRRSIFH